MLSAKVFAYRTFKVLSIYPSQSSSIPLQVSVPFVPAVAEQVPYSPNLPLLQVFVCTPLLAQAPTPFVHDMLSAKVFTEFTPAALSIYPSQSSSIPLQVSVPFVPAVAEQTAQSLQP